MRSRRGIVIVVAVGALLRFVPIWFALPFDRARPDEETAIGHALAVLAGDPNPHFFHWPSLTFYLFAAAFAVAPGASPNAQFLIARAMVAAAGTATIVVLYAMVRESADEATAWSAALLLAVSPLHVRESHFAMTDVLMSLLGTAAIAVRMRAGDRLWWFATAGLLGGLAASTKYTGAAILVLLCLPPYRLAFATAFVIGFVAGTPYAILDARSFVGGFGFDVTHLSTGQALVDAGRGWSYHLLRSLPYGLGLPVFAAAVGGVCIIVAQRRLRSVAVPAVFCLALYAALAPGRTVFFRYVLPMVPLLCAAAAIALRELDRVLSARVTRSFLVPVTLAIALPSVVNSVWMDALLARTDTRVLAGRWLAEHTQPNDSIYDAGGDYAGSDLLGVTAHRWSAETFDPAAKAFRDSGGRLPDWIVLPESPLVYGSVPPSLRQLAEDRYALVDTIRATDGDTSSSVYDLQDAFFLPIAGFRPVLRPGPTVKIYRKLY